MKNNKKTESCYDLPLDIKPREKLGNSGPASLSDKELLAVILNTGIRGKNVFELADELLGLLDDNKDIPAIK
jgi:DNA repair protein RadC